MDLALRIQSNKMGNSQPSEEDNYHLIWRVLARVEVCTGGGALGRAGCWKVGQVSQGGSWVLRNDSELGGD